MIYGIDKWIVQMNKGYLELAILMYINKKGMLYGGEIIQFFQSEDIDIQEGTLYPLLNRMHKNEWLISEWQLPENNGHPRRYYQLSLQIKQLLPAMLDIYHKNSNFLDKIGKENE